MGFFDELLGAVLAGCNDAMQQSAEENKVSPSNPRRSNRIRQEVMMIAPRFSKDGGGIEFDEENCDWLIINNYALPDRWNERWCRLMIIFPQGYPDMPPIGFYLNKKFNLKRGATDSHFTGKAHYGASDLVEQGWHWYCVHLANGAWQPKADYNRADNLWTYLNMIRESLTNDF